MRQIHPSAIVDPNAELGEDVSVGPYTIIKAGVTIGAGTVVQEHCSIHSGTIIGKGCRIGPASYVGLAPQHLKHDGANSFLVIGDSVIIREMASAHRSIRPGIENATRVGNRCMLMASCHVAHDCVLEDEVILANGVLLGGHCHLARSVFLGGGARIHQFVRIGRLAIVAGNEAFTHDVPPFAAVRYRGLKGYNAIGCKRNGMSRETIRAVRAAYYCIHTNRSLSDATAAMRDIVPKVPEVQEILDFIATSHRGVLHSVHFRNKDGDNVRTAESEMA